MDSRLGKLNYWLEYNFKNYLSMIAIGSIATGDRWVEGRSDRDILLIFEKGIEKVESIENSLKVFNFDDTYAFTTIKKEEFIGPENSSHDFSHKFRSKILFGENLIKEAKLPNREKILEIYSNGLNEVISTLEKKLYYGKLWSEKKVRDTSWKLFKHSFMYLAIKCYYEKEFYPNTRKLISKEFNSKELYNTLQILNNIDTKSKKEIFGIYPNLLNFLRKQQ